MQLLEDVDLLLRALSRREGYGPSYPPSEKQREFFALTDDEAFYGGAAGGGKTDAVLWLAVDRCSQYQRYDVLILRRTFRDLNQPDAVMHRAHSWLQDTDVKWSAENKRYTFPNGSTITFGYLEHENDKYQYQGAAFDLVIFDELTQFTETQYTYLFSRLRGDGKSPCNMRATGNPGGVGHAWVYARFIDPSTAIAPFIPAKLDDNPHFHNSDAGRDYRAKLSKLDGYTRQQLEDGVWLPDSAGLVYAYDHLRNSMAYAPNVKRKGLAIDYGVTSPTSFTILGWNDTDATLYVLRSWKIKGLIPQDATAITAKLNTEHRFEFIVGDMGGLGKGFTADAQRAGVPVEAADKSNKLGYIKLLNGELEQQKIKIVTADCKELVHELQSLPWNAERNAEAKGFDNHCTDGMLYGWRRARAAGRVTSVKYPVGVGSKFSKW